MSIERLRAIFANPPAASRVAPFWFLNHRLDEDEMRWQVREMHDHGVGGFVLHARHGLLTPYMSDEWMSNLAAAIEEARLRGMKAYLYDENNWPSGPADGKVFDGHPEYRMSGLYLRGRFEVEVTAELALPLNLEAGDELVAVVAVPADGGNPVGFPESARLLNSAVDGEQLVARLPAGQWIIYVFVRRYLVGRTFFGTYLDTLSPEAVRRFVELTHEAYAERFGKDFGATIEGIFTDEPTMNFNPPDAAPWTAALPGEFGWRKGYELLPVLPALFEDMGPRTAKIRCDFYDVVSELYAESFFGQIYRWCDANRIKLMGHPMFEGELIEHCRQQGDWFRIMRYMHWGGVDQLCELTWPSGDGLNNLAGPKFASSASHLLGKPRTDCECFGLASQWAINLRNLKWMADWLACLGVNIFIPHAFYYSIQGFRKWECPPNEFYQSSFWPYYQLFADHIARLAALLSDGQHIADVAFLYPNRSVWSELAPHGTDTARYLQRHFNMLGEALLRLNFDFDFVSEQMLQHAEVSAGELIVKGDDGAERERFKAVVLPALTTISRKTAEALARIAAAGVPVIATGTLPTRSVEEGEDIYLQRQLRALFGDAYDQSLAVASAEAPVAVTDLEGSFSGAAVIGLPPKITDEVLDVLGSALRAAITPDVQIVMKNAQPAADVIHYHWRRDGLDFFVVHNTSRERAASVLARLSVRGAPSLWDPDSGQIRPAPIARTTSTGLELPLELPPAGTVVVGIEPGAKPLSPVVDASVEVLSIEDDHIVGLARRGGPQCVEVARPDGTVTRVTAKVREVPETVELDDEWSFTTLKPNALPLTQWQMRMDNKVTGRDHAHPNTFFATSFVCEFIPQDARLLLDGLAVEKIFGGTAPVEFEVFVNGQRIERWQRGEYLDHYILEAPVGELLKEGTNEIIIRTGTIFVEMPAVRYPAILVGHFAVGRGRRPRLIPEPGVIGRRGWDRQGYPYYSGIGIYTQTVRLSRSYLACRLALELTKVGDMAEVLVNGRSCGARGWEPWRVDITDAAVAGDNVVEIRVANSMQNLLVQEPKASGILGPVRIVAARQVRFDISGGV